MNPNDVQASLNVEAIKEAEDSFLEGLSIPGKTSGPKKSGGKKSNKKKGKK